MQQLRPVMLIDANVSPSANHFTCGTNLFVTFPCRVEALVQLEVQPVSVYVIEPDVPASLDVGGCLSLIGNKYFDLCKARDI